MLKLLKLSLWHQLCPFCNTCLFMCIKLVLVDRCCVSGKNNSVTQTTQINILIRFSAGSAIECINMSINVSENTIEYFLKNVNYVIAF